MFRNLQKKIEFPSPEDALSGRTEPIKTSELHHIYNRPLKGPYPDSLRLAMFGMGCFWGAERLFWQLSGVWMTAVGYSGGLTPNPTYKEVCTGLTGHNEVVRVVYDPTKITYEDLLGLFFERHDPTQGMRQGNDIGTQYRSGIYAYYKEDKELAIIVRDRKNKVLLNSGRGPITTEIIDAPPFYYAEDYHQQYLAKI